MKIKTLKVLFLSVSIVSLSLVIAGCAAMGSNPTPPNKVESVLFNTTTNYVPVVIPAYVTNQVTVTSYQTNVQGVAVTQYLTNIVPVTVPASITNVPSYTETPKQSVTAGVQGAGGVLNVLFPGIGSIASNAVLALLGFYGYLRSSKLGNTAAVLAQNVQLARNILQSVPNGAALDNAFVTFIQNHQADEGVIQQVMATIAAEVNNSDAKVAAQQIAATVQALTSATAPKP